MSDHITSWPELGIALFEKLNERDAEIIYEFDEMKVWVPSSTAEDSPAAPWKMHGTIKIRTQDGVSA